jgi:dipeptidyl-peptidase 4
MLRFLFIFAMIHAATASVLNAQGTAADYQRAETMAKRVSGQVTQMKLEPHWFDNNQQFWYKRELPNGKYEFRVVRVEDGKSEPAFDHQRLAAAWNLAAKSKHELHRLPIQQLQLNAERTELTWTANGKTWQCDLQTYTMQPAKANLAMQQNLNSDLTLTKSRKQGEETEIRFDNQTERSVKLFWIDEAGERHAYGRIAAGEQRAQHTFAGHLWLVTNNQEEELAKFLATAEPATAIIVSPKEKQRQNPASDSDEDSLALANEINEKPIKTGRLTLREHQVWWRDPATNQERQLTTDGTADNSYSGPQFVSPDGHYAVVIRMQPVEVRKIHIVESSPKDQLQPKLKTLNYAKPGDPLEQREVSLFDLKTGQRIDVNQSLFRNQWSLDHWKWTADSSEFRFLFNQRGHQVLRLLALNPQTGKVRTIIDEQSKTFIDYSGKFYLKHLPKSDQYLWMSERDGWNHLYLIDAKSGKAQQLTNGDWVIRNVDRVDEAAGEIWFRANGLDADQDPYYVHYCRLNLTTRQMTRLTAGDGTHDVQYSPDNKHLIATYSRVDQPPVHELRRVSDGKLIAELERADWSALVATGWRAPERFKALGRDGKTPIYGVICRPSNFDAKRKYPVIEKIYAGPQSAFVPKKFSAWHGNLQSYAELGFIMVQIDGMGTSHRSKAFHDVCWQNLADAGLPDRILWHQAAAKHEPTMDLSRVGIFGGSAGGQNALGALLTHPEFYKVAVADCGCHDNRMDKIWWNEQWMGYPIGPHYAAQSNVTLAKNLQGKLLLTVGEVDSNVDPASTMQVVNALVKADKDFDLLVLPGMNHGAGESSYADRRRKDFFVRHLHGVEPRR